MCRKRFKASGMKGYPLEEVNEALGTIKDIKSCLQPENEDESRLLLCLMDIVPDDETDNVDVIFDNINKHVESGKKQIWWKNLFKLDLAGRGIVKEVVEQQEQQNVQFGGAEAEHQQQQSDRDGGGGTEKQQNAQFSADASGFSSLAEMMETGFKRMNEMFEGLERRLTVLEGGKEDMTGWDERTPWNTSQDENPVVAEDGEKQKKDEVVHVENQVVVGDEVVAGEEKREEENEVGAGDEVVAGEENREEENEVVVGDEVREEENEVGAGDEVVAGKENREEENEVFAREGDSPKKRTRNLVVFCIVLCHIFVFWLN